MDIQYHRNPSFHCEERREDPTKHREIQVFHVEIRVNSLAKFLVYEARLFSEYKYTIYPVLHTSLVTAQENKEDRSSRDYELLRRNDKSCP